MTPKASASTWLVSCSPERTLLARRETGARGETEITLIKLFEQGSMSSAQRELAFARLLHGEGFAKYREAKRDPSSGKPSLTMDFYAGSDLQSLLQERGSLNSQDALWLGAQLADRLVELGLVRAKPAPQGLVHRDIKPGNILLHGDVNAIQDCRVIVLDMEHAVALGNSDRDLAAGEFSGGSPGYSPPEAYRGATPELSFDVFGLACTLHLSLTGRAAFLGKNPSEIAAAIQRCEPDAASLAGIAPEIKELLASCLSEDPAARPSAADLAKSLRELGRARSACDLVADGALRDIHSGAITSAREKLAGIPETDRGSRWQELHELCAELESYIDSHPLPPAMPGSCEGLELARGLLERAVFLADFLAQIPAHPSALEHRREVLQNTASLLLQVPRLATDSKRGGDFSSAQELVQLSLELLATVDRIGRIPIAGATEQGPPPPLKDPRRFLTSTKRDLDFAAEQHAKLYEALMAAEAALDLSRAEQVLGSFARVYGGASDIVADLKDRVHRLDFYLARMARLRPCLEPLREQLQSSGIAIDLQPLDEFLVTCARHMPSEGVWQSEPESESLLRLQRYVVELVSEYPHVDERVGHAREVLGKALGRITDDAWELLDEADKKLSAPPIPIRPLQGIINHLDHLRVAEMLIDRPDRERRSLLERLEDLRMRIDHARAARDRITRGARAAMEEGHLTTALYEISRAVDRFDDKDAESPSEGSPLALQFAEAKRRKEEIEEAQRKNHQLANLSATLKKATDPSEVKVSALLQERERVLHFLCTSLGREQSELYSQDLQLVQLELMRVQASRGEQLVASAQNAKQRMVIAEQTLLSLRRRSPIEGAKLDLIEEAQALIKTWEGIHRRASGELSDEVADRRAVALSARTQRSRWMTGAVASLAAIALSFLFFQLFWSEETEAVASLSSLENSLRDLRSSGSESSPLESRAETLLVLIKEMREGNQVAQQSWVPRLTAAILAYDEALEGVPAGVRSAWLEFGRKAHKAALRRAEERLGSESLLEHLAKTSGIGIAAN